MHAMINQTHSPKEGTITLVKIDFRVVEGLYIQGSLMILNSVWSFKSIAYTVS